MNKRLIIINRMYAGRYLTEGENIGHEVINLIRADNGNNYLWLNADGNCDRSKFLRKDDSCCYDEIIMLMVRMYGPRQWKVLAKAEIDISALSEYMVPKFGPEYHKKQENKIEEEKICYGQKPLNEIFDNNKFNDQLQSDIDIYFTFKAKNVLLPVSEPGNLGKTVIPIGGMSGLANQSLRMYLDGEKNEETYRFFNGIIDGERFQWETENTTATVDAATVLDEDESDYFLKIINEEDRELSFSNLLAYFLGDKQIMSAFAKEVLKIDDFDQEHYSITREEKNIDLFISSPTHYLIIENKIRSGLISEKRDMKNKLKEYFGEENEETERLLKIFGSKTIHYQTDRYYAYASGVVFRQKSKAKIKGYVLFPNYAEHRVTEQMKDTLFSEHFSPVTYKKVYDFFEKLDGAEWLDSKKQLYLKEFLWAMKKHTKDVDNVFEEEMKRRFYKKIQNS